ncbi:MAG: thiamine-phosphate kinase [Hydrogenothermaceae bacterium]
MVLKDVGEFGLIDRLSKIILEEDRDILVNIGDDTACIKVCDNKNLLLTVDTQVENVHFIKDRINPVDLGWKLSTANVSDIVACGGYPKYALVSASLPKNLEVDFIESVYYGIREAQDFYRFKTVGGNITSSNQIMIDMTLIGESSTFIPRSGGKPGHYLYLTGYTGLSRAGLDIILSEKKDLTETEKFLVKSHYRPTARLDKLSILLKFAKSSIDISDGLVADLYHISKQSKVKVVIQKYNLPMHPALLEYCESVDKDFYDYILYGGEDYQIAFTSDSFIEEEDIYLIGYISEGEGVFLEENNRSSKLHEKGFNHLI